MPLTTMPRVALSADEVHALIAGITGYRHTDRFGSSTVYPNPAGTNPYLVPTIVVDDEPAVMGNARAFVSVYRLGLPKYGLPLDAIVLHLDYACDCKAGHDAPCGASGCWGTEAPSAMSR